MLVLSETFGGYPAGTVLMAGMSVPPDYSQGRMELYASTDGGLTWRYVSRIAEGGRMTTKNGDKAIWEPFLLVHGDQLICYYSDQRNPLHGQKLVHTTTRNLRDWTPVTDDVAFPKYTARPGMAVVAHIRETGKYIMTFEYVGSPTGGSPVWCKIADDPLSFARATAYPIKSSDGEIPDSSPYTIWVDVSSMSRSSGMLIMNAASHNQIWINDASANPSNWTLFPSGQKRAHTRKLEVITNPKGVRKLMNCELESTPRQILNQEVLTF
ncbi:hypothetical protein H9Q72_012591 [Fusarium xylarioides]|uniref:Uncharacterized protein n=1 Tax=Fusarium xylarioides TaxID=221167 RepID=A0A9P7L0C8_9HYPO|nr:hypothetical protein H9Q72_012591 [Fusarium xylarioides]